MYIYIHYMYIWIYIYIYIYICMWIIDYDLYTVHVHLNSHVVYRIPIRGSFDSLSIRKKLPNILRNTYNYTYT